MRNPVTNGRTADNGALEANTRLVTPMGMLTQMAKYPLRTVASVPMFRPALDWPFISFAPLPYGKDAAWVPLAVRQPSLPGRNMADISMLSHPKDGLPGVPSGALLKLVQGASGLRAAPRLWYLHAREVLRAAGLAELQTANACFVLREPTTRETLAMLVLHCDDACFVQGMVLHGATY